MQQATGETPNQPVSGQVRYEEENFEALRTSAAARLYRQIMAVRPD
ncbi:MAG: hypothetical protein IID51_14550 [Proteobacteria bacterium]|nr:hypothetical protein [Pseudomonadota bacterium]